MYKLQILELIVSGYERLALSSTKEITITPNNIHLILGTNGSGKSSIMELLTPLPPNNKDFREDGYKLIKFLYDGKHYSVYSINNKHFLYRENETILDGVGVQMMTDYVREYFNITPNTHRFMLGKINMCNMSLQNRKEFITNISGIDFDYVNKLYNHLKKQLRDCSGVVKYINNNILSMKEYILSDVEVETLMKEKDEIKRLIVRLHEHKKPDRNNILINRPEILQIEKRYNNVVECLKEYDMDIDKLKSKHLLTTAKLEESNKKLIEISNTLSKLVNNNTSDVLSRIKEIKERVIYLKSIITLPIEYLSLVDKNIEYSSDDILTEISKISLSLADETNISIENNITDIDSKLLELSNKQKELKTNIDTASTEISTYRVAMNGIVCPECSFKFSENSVSNIITKLESHIESMHPDMYKLENDIKEYKQILSELSDKRKDKERLEFMISSIKLKSIDIEFNTYNDVYRHTLLLDTELKAYKEMNELLEEDKKLSSITISTQDDDILKYTKEYDKLEDTIKVLDSDIISMKKTISLYDQMNNDMSVLNKYLIDANKNRRTAIYSYYNKASNALIFELNNKLSKIETTLDKYNYMSKSTNENIKELERVNKDIELLEILIKELSPSTGLIAESLKSFLLEYIRDVNNIISNVWSYDMEVLPYDVKELEKGISYRFPVRVKDQKPVPDINDTSESMREIINIAFRIVSLKYMGLLKYPLLIDEFGRSMDEIHLIKSYDLLESICLENDIQMFIIAHIKSAYNRFKNSGITIVSSLNLEDME